MRAASQLATENDRRFLVWVQYAGLDELSEFFEERDYSWFKWRTVAVKRELKRRRSF